MAQHQTYIGDREKRTPILSVHIYFHIAISNMWEKSVARELWYNDFSLKRKKIGVRDSTFDNCGTSGSSKLTGLEIDEERQTQSNMKNADASLYFL